jgi:hypothetical protein
MKEKVWVTDSWVTDPWVAMSTSEMVAMYSWAGLRAEAAT